MFACCSYKVEGDEQTAHAELRGLKLVTQINLGTSDSSSEVHSHSCVPLVQDRAGVVTALCCSFTHTKASVKEERH